MQEHAVHHGVHLDVADTSADESHGVPADLDRLERQRGEGAEGVEDRVLGGESIQATQQDSWDHLLLIRTRG